MMCLLCFLCFFCFVEVVILVFFFFFSSRRRHTRWPRDWSSDVCSSDLGTCVDKATTNQSYEPFAQVPFSSLNVVIRTSGPSTALLGAIRPTVYAVDKDQPIGTIRPLEEIVADSIARQRFAMTLLTVFSLVALVIAAVGIYGVMAYSVVQRTGEFGIRMALGAQQRDVLSLVLAQGGKLVGLGLIIGLAATLAASRAMGSMLFNTSTEDPLTLGT